MVYKTDLVRHTKTPLRLSSAETDAVVESLPLSCTHYDAYRFFTEQAIPKNKNLLTRDAQIESDQPGCIHVNMDLYKFAYKLFPYINGSIIREAFLHAVNAREIDMRASPYDFSKDGFNPIQIETSEGRLEYVAAQKMIAAEGQLIREKLLSEVSRLKDLLCDRA